MIHSNARIDLVGHSFGTHLIGWALQRIATKSRSRFHTVILAGSVLRQNYDWSSLFQKAVVKRVINECGIHDKILVLNQVVVLLTGMAGRIGFRGMTSSHFANRFFVGGHSLYFEKSGQANDDFMKQYWLPLLLEESAIDYVDERTPPTAIDGVVTTVLQNFEIIKMTIYTLLLLTPAIIFMNLYHEAKAQYLRAENERAEAINTVEWVFNQTAYIPFDRSNFNEKTLPLIKGMLLRLKKAGYKGKIALTGHLGKFQVIKGPDDSFEVASAWKLDHLKSGEQLDYGGYTKEYAQALGWRHTVAVRNIALDLGLQNVSMISYGNEKDVVAYPDDSADVDKWNQAAELNNCIKMALDRQEEKDTIK